MKYFSKERISTFNIHYDLYTLDYFLDCQAKLGITNVELLAGHQGLYVDYNGHCDAKVIKKKLDDRGLHCAVISPENCGFQYQFAVKDPLLKERAFNYFKNGMHLGVELGAKLMQANSGWGFWNEDKDEALKRSAEMHRRLCDVAEELDMTIACETLRPEESLIGYRVEDLKRLFDMVNHPRFKVMIDITAMAVAGETIQQWFDIFGSENIIHTHFQDSNPYGHLVWGDGHHNLGEFLKVLHDNNYQGLLSQELTLRDYFLDPFHYDKRNIAVLNQYVY